MKSIFTTLLACACLYFTASAQLVISEIMYNPPEAGTDSLEYIEVYNVSSEMLDMTGYTFTGIVHTVGEVLLAPGEAYVVCVNSSAFEEIFGTTCFQWDSGGLSNGGETIAVADSIGNVIDEVVFDDNGAWPTEAEGTDGGGASIELCDLTSDNNDGSNWRASNNIVGMNVEGVNISGTPFSLPMNGLCDVVALPSPSAGDLVITEIMYNDPGDVDQLEFIEIFNVTETAFDISGLIVTSGNIDFTFPMGTELPRQSYMILCQNQTKMQEAFGISPMEWGVGNLNDNGATITLTMPGELIDELTYDTSTDWPSLANGFGNSINLCDFSLDNNLGESWQAALSTTDYAVNGTNIFANPSTASVCNVPIGVIRTNDANGVPLLLGEKIVTTGIVHGLNYRPSGLQFTIIDDALEHGIATFSGSDNYGYTVAEGDVVTVYGTVSNFNGLAQISLDNVILLATDASIATPRVVTSMDESTESYLIKFENMRLVDVSQWDAVGSGFNVDITNGVDTIEMRIDADCDIFALPYPEGTFDVIGLGGQFDSSFPQDEGYQILPRYQADITAYTVSAEDIDIDLNLSISPNPSSDWINIEAEMNIESVQIFDNQGALVLKSMGKSGLNVAHLTTGVYRVVVSSGTKIVVKNFMKI